MLYLFSCIVTLLTREKTFYTFYDNWKGDSYQNESKIIGLSEGYCVVTIYDNQDH